MNLGERELLLKRVDYLSTCALKLAEVDPCVSRHLMRKTLELVEHCNLEISDRQLLLFCNFCGTIRIPGLFNKIRVIKDEDKWSDDYKIMEELNYELVDSGNSYLVLRQKLKSAQFGDSCKYLLKLSKKRENSLTTKFKLVFARKLEKIFSNLPYFYQLNRYLITIDSSEAYRIRSAFGTGNKKISPQAGWKEYCFYEEHALHKGSKMENSPFLTFELKAKCGLIDFVDMPNIFKLLRGMCLGGKEEVFDPKRLFAASPHDVKDQVQLLLKGSNTKYLKIYSGEPRVDTIAKAILNSRELIDKLLVMQSYGSGQQFIAHTLYILLDIYFNIHGQVTDSWKIHYLQWLYSLDIPDNKDNNAVLNQMKHFNEGLTLIKTLLILTHQSFLFKLINKISQRERGIKYNPFIKIRRYLSKQLEKYRKTPVPNKSEYRLNSYTKLYKKHDFIRKSIIWLQKFFLARTAMDCSLFYSINTNNAIKIALVDLDIKPYSRISKWADDAYKAMELHRN